MKIEEQVLSIEQAKHLQQLGLDMSDSALVNIHLPNGKWEVSPRWIFNLDNLEYVPTYILQEVLDKIPDEIKIGDELFFSDIIMHPNEMFYANVDTLEDLKESVMGYDSILETAFHLLCWVLKNGFYKEDK